MTEEKLEGLAVQLGTPSFVFDTDILKKRAGWIKEMIHPAKLCFAIKANPFLVEALEPQVIDMKCVLRESFTSVWRESFPWRRLFFPV